LSERQRWTGRQRRIGLTGGIASGKSSVSQFLAQQGIPVLDADVYAREALAPGSKAAETVLQRFSHLLHHPPEGREKVDAASRRIDRQALGQIVFNDAVERLWLEQLIHPIVKERLEKEIELHSKASALALVIPLLFETGLDKLCTEVWVVSCSKQQQQERLMTRNGLSAIAAARRIEAQWPLERKRLLADHVINNSGITDSWQNQVLQLL
jgi:dephospho-CoA kinase